MKIPLVIQTHPGENAIAAIASMLSYYGRITNLSELREGNITSRGGSTPEQVKEMSAAYGLDCEIMNIDIEELKKQSFPIVVRWKKSYYCIIKKIAGEKVYLADPSKGDYVVELEMFTKNYRGVAIKMTPNKTFKKGGKRPSVYGLIFGRLKDVKSRLLMLALLNVLAVGLNLLMINSTKDMLDYVSTSKNVDNVIGEILSLSIFEDISAYEILVIAMSVILIASTAVNIFKTLLIFRTSYSVAASSGTDLFRKILHQPMGFFEQYKSGELIQRLDDNSSLDLSLVKTIVPRILDFFMTIIYFVLIMSYHWKVALMCIAVEVIYLIVSMQMRGRIVMQARSNAVNTGNMNTSILNGMDTIETIKAGGSERLFFTGWKTTQSEMDTSRINGIGLTSMSNVIDSVHALLSQAILLFAGAYFIINGEMTMGIMAALQSVLVQFRNSFSNCISMTHSLQRTRTDIERIEDIRERDEMPVYELPEDAEPDKLKGELKVSHLSYRYQKGEPLSLDDVSFEVKPGQLVAVVGSSGCGKSTLMKCLLSLYEPESGEIRYNGLLREEIPDVVFHSTITAVDQECVVFEDTIANNMTVWDSTVSDFEMILAARDAHIHKRIMKEKDGYYARMLENGRNFSGGEIQRLELARALSAEPTILLLDEFTSALDAVTEEEVFKSIRLKGTTCVIVAHRLSTVSSCDYILVMEKGKIVQQGTPDELYKVDGPYRRLLQIEGA
ncbi:ABC-type bacteriocin/lantibiotic exporter, contains an N-terminal double-glycine peptidase domain [Ruminococcaceae bacterium YRB3002]|nr:ABC-type bacteriocin/lantibiotic exporter, contains an N-terminal double-glycine peptidase domain [Ruminococcaceae bacterium YRB3002]